MNTLTKEFMKRLFMRFSTIFGSKFVSIFQTDELIEMWWEDWADGLAGISPEMIKPALDHCRLNLDWPPSVAEFRALCEKYSGMPTVKEAMQAAIRGEFSHPIIKLCYDSVGSWDMKNNSEKDLLKKFNEAYQEEIAKLRMNQYRQYKLETDKKISPLKGISQDETKSLTDRSNDTRDTDRRKDLRKAEAYLLSGRKVD